MVVWSSSNVQVMNASDQARLPVTEEKVMVLGLKLVTGGRATFLRGQILNSGVAHWRGALAGSLENAKRCERKVGKPGAPASGLPAHGRPCYKIHIWMTFDAASSSALRKRSRICRQGVPFPLKSHNLPPSILSNGGVFFVRHPSKCMSPIQFNNARTCRACTNAKQCECLLSVYTPSKQLHM